MKIQDFFDKGYYLNLDRRTDRRTLFEDEVRPYGLLNFLERRSAEDCLLRPDITYKHFFCSYSFDKIFQDAYEKGYEKIVIFEDDFVFLNEESQGIDNIEKGLDQLANFPDWDIIYFGGYVFDKEIHQVSPNLLKANTVLTTHGIGFTRSAIKQLLNFRPFIDSAIDGWMGQRYEINKYIIYPLSCYQREISSDLDAWGNTPALSHFKKNYIQGNLIKLNEKDDQ